MKKNFTQNIEINNLNIIQIKIKLKIGIIMKNIITVKITTTIITLKKIYQKNQNYFHIFMMKIK